MMSFQFSRVRSVIYFQVAWDNFKRKRLNNFIEKSIRNTYIFVYFLVWVIFTHMEKNFEFHCFLYGTYFRTLVLTKAAENIHFFFVFLSSGTHEPISSLSILFKFYFKEFSLVKDITPGLVLYLPLIQKKKRRWGTPEIPTFVKQETEIWKIYINTKRTFKRLRQI